MSTTVSPDFASLAKTAAIVLRFYHEQPCCPFLMESKTSPYSFFPLLIGMCESTDLMVQNSLTQCSTRHLYEWILVLMLMTQLKRTSGSLQTCVRVHPTYHCVWRKGLGD